MKLFVGNVTTRVTGYTEEERAFLEALLTVEHPNHRFMAAYKLYVKSKGTQGWNGLHAFFSPFTQSFPTGFLPYILMRCKRKKYPVTAVDLRTQFLYAPETEHFTGLRWYQQDAVQALLLGELQIGAQVIPWARGIIKAPTGSGKTPLTARLIYALNTPTLYLVESIDNMIQTQGVIKEWTGEPCGIMGDGRFQPEQVTVCSLRTLMSRGKALKSYFQSIQCVVVDECHRAGAGQNEYHKVMMSLPNAWCRVGISATPLSRKDLGDATLIGDTGEIAYEVQRKVLEDEGYLSKNRVIFLRNDRPVMHDAKYPIAYETMIVENPHRNGKIIWAAKKLLAKGRTILILVKVIKHGVILQRLLAAEGIKCFFVSGKDSSTIRTSLLKGVGGGFKVLIGSNIFNQSIDCPVLDDLIIAAGGDSAINTIQRAGRVLRPKTHGENVAHTIDFIDAGSKYLLAHSEHRLATYKQEGFEVHIA